MALSCIKALIAAFDNSGINYWIVERGKNTWSKEDEQEVEFLPRTGTSHCASFNTAITKGSLMQAVTRQHKSSISIVLPSPGLLWLPSRGQVKPLPCSYSWDQELHRWAARGNFSFSQVVIWAGVCLCSGHTVLAVSEIQIWAGLCRDSITAELFR